MVTAVAVAVADTVAVGEIVTNLATTPGRVATRASRTESARSPIFFRSVRARAQLPFLDCFSLGALVRTLGKEALAIEGKHARNDIPLSDTTY